MADVSLCIALRADAFVTSFAKEAIVVAVLLTLTYMVKLQLMLQDLFKCAGTHIFFLLDRLSAAGAFVLLQHVSAYFAQDGSAALRAHEDLIYDDSVAYATHAWHIFSAFDFLSLSVYGLCLNATEAIGVNLIR